MRRVGIVAALVGIRVAQAQPVPPDAEPPPQPPAVVEPPPAVVEPTPAPPVVVEPPAREVFRPALQIHGFISEGAFVSTDNDFIGHSSRGSLEFFQAAINVQTDLTDKLRAGIQLFSQDEGVANDATPRLDWAYLDYRYQPWLGLRVGRVRLPFGLYNDYIDIDAARTQILLPQSVYPISDRNVLTAQNGVAIYGTRATKSAGAIDYQAYAGVLSIPLPPAQDANSARIFSFDSKYIIGAHLFWRPPVDGLRVGGSVLRASLDSAVGLPPATVAGLIASGAAPADFDGNVTLSIRPATFLVASAEYTRGDWVFAAEYSRWYTRAFTTPVDILPPGTSISERFYALATYRLSPKLDSGIYYSELYQDVRDRSGTNPAEFPTPELAWSRDAALSFRYDITDNWLLKAEAHFIDGAASLTQVIDPKPERYWGLFLVRTTVTF